MGFTVKRDHNAKQHGSTCGLVAARVTTWLHDSGSDFMTATTTEAVNWPVIEEANTAIQRALRNTATTTSDEVQRAANYFNHGDCELFHLVDEPRTSPDAPNDFPRETYDQTGRFLKITSYDILLYTIARDVHKARGGRVPIKKFIISNNQDSTRRGWHWVSCVYEIKRKSSGALQIRGRGPLAVGLSGVMDFELEGSGGAPSQAALNGLCSLGDAATAVFTIAMFYTVLANQVALYITAGTLNQVIDIMLSMSNAVLDYAAVSFLRAAAPWTGAWEKRDP